MKTNCCDCCHPAIIDQDACGCCEGMAVVTPLSTYNRPGLSQIRYRIGTHAGFLESMTARLTGYFLEKQDEQGNLAKVYPLQGLTTRDAGDPSIALLDAWATVGDVLTFYQERIANEGYLRTATERRSVVELARLVGYKPRPGVSASVFLAYNIDANTQEEVSIPAGSKAQSIPGPGEMPQTFETGEALKARALWNNLQPRMTQAQTFTSITDNARVYLKGLSTNIKVNDALLIVFNNTRHFAFAYDVIPQNAWDRTLVSFIEPQPPGFSDDLSFSEIIRQLVRPASLQPANKFQLQKAQGQSLAAQFALKNTAELNSEGLNSSVFNNAALFAENGAGVVAQPGYSVLSAFSSVLKNNLATATASIKLTPQNLSVYQLGIKAALFGHNLPLPVNGVCPNLPSVGGGVILLAAAAVTADNFKVLALDAEYQNIKQGAIVAIRIGANDPIYAKTLAVDTVTLGGPQTGALSFFSTCPTITTSTVNGQSTVTVSDPIKNKVTVLTLDTDWRDATTSNTIITNTTVYIQNGNLELAEEPITDAICGSTDEVIELDGFYQDLDPGRWVIVSGERNEVEGVRYSESALLASVVHSIKPGLPDEKLHTFIQFAEKLAYCFKRDTIRIYGNVTKATHGETRQEVLGSGDGANALQTFTLKQKPLTYVSAANPSGVDSTLKVFVNNVEWHETDSLAGQQANGRVFTSKTDNDDNTSVTFGNGKQGARLPTGMENIKAQYRNGIGSAGNVRAEQISLLLSKPLGVKEVINPLRASGGADRETGDQARQHVPLAVKALDRLVSTQDYEDFARLYAGIGKAKAAELTNGRQQVVHVTVAGAGDIPIDETSDLFINLRLALHAFGDTSQFVQLAVRELLFIVVEAGIAILPDYRWEAVVAEVRGTLLDQFSFERRELGQDVFLSEILSVMQSVSGVAYVDVDAFGGIPEKLTDGEARRLLTPDEISEAVDCLVTRWSSDDMDAACAFVTASAECSKFRNCKKYGDFGKTLGVRQWLPVNSAGLENGVIHPAQLAFLSPDVPATLILTQIK